MECCPMFCSIYLSLLILTAGFVLSVCSWLAPLLSSFVYNVRIIGVLCLIIGGFILALSCLVSALNDGRCCKVCYACDKNDDGAFSLAGLIANPVINATAIVGRDLYSDFDDENAVSDDITPQCSHHCSFISEEINNTQQKGVKTFHQEALSNKGSDYRQWKQRNSMTSFSLIDRAKLGYIPLRVNDPELQITNSNYSDVIHCLPCIPKHQRYTADPLVQHLQLGNQNNDIKDLNTLDNSCTNIDDVILVDVSDPVLVATDNLFSKSDTDLNNRFDLSCKRKMSAPERSLLTTHF